MRNLFLSLLSILVLPSITFAQGEITLEDIWKNYTFYSRAVPGFNFLNDGKHYTRLEQGNQVQQYDLTSGDFVKTLFNATEIEGLDGSIDGYEFSADESKMVISKNTESIYRHSTRSDFFVWDGKALDKVFEEGKVRYATLDEAGEQIAFVFGNDLYFKNLASGKTTQITSDGEYNAIINGATDWVYEEEFAIWRGFEWSPDGKKIAYYRFDERHVKEFVMKNYKDELYPEIVTFKYPKVGEANAYVDIYIYDIESVLTIHPS